MIDNTQIRIGVIGLGYVGLPLAHALSEHFPVIGFDLNERRITELKNGHDRTHEITQADLQKSSLKYTNSAKELKDVNFYIVTVPTPLDHTNNPDLGFLESASTIVGELLSENDIVVYESTVYPGVTEDYCIPILESNSHLVAGKDFFVGYSPERINPGDKKHTLKTIKKIVSAQTDKSLEVLSNVYSTVVEAGIHKASSIKVAEAAKVIENSQRDINIAFVNELSIIFEKMEIDTLEVLEAASTKWNFLNFIPGLVGGHCIGIDPYYLTYKATLLGVKPHVILCGRETNDSMGTHIGEIIIKKLIEKKKNFFSLNIGIFGLSFKENCPDIRNSKVEDIYKFFQSLNINTLIHDPLVYDDSVAEEYGRSMNKIDEMVDLDVAIVAVCHDYYRELGPNYFTKSLKGDGSLIFDVKGMFNKSSFMKENIEYIRL